MFSLFDGPREYPAYYQEYYDRFDFYNGRTAWLHSIRDIPEKAVHLFALHWLHLEVYNGGFWQYFFNSTGTSMPEAVAGFQAIGMPSVAEVIERAAARLGNPFPFDIEERRRIVGMPDNRMDFESFDSRFYDLADTEKVFRRVPRFVPYADAYARKGSA